MSEDILPFNTRIIMLIRLREQLFYSRFIRCELIFIVRLQESYIKFSEISMQPYKITVR